MKNRFKKYELVVPGWSPFEITGAEAGEAILGKGPVLVDEDAVIEAVMSRKELLRFAETFKKFIENNDHVETLSFYIRKTDNKK